jgi:signal transduction histidine kinase
VQAFRNIFENSLAACQDPTIIRISCNDASIDGQPAAEITIDDNGPGFHGAALDRAFEPFFTTKSTGTGLGLSIVRRVVEAHDGMISAHSAEPRGARLRILLPVMPLRAS